ncbi:MAG: hypothetical protein P4M11_04325 [Candidatus Pacebacteria bacterium]|nr:hypothetical protein [Candidatus Paceibacterota bacterium]
MHDELIIPGDEKIIAILKQSLKDSYDTQLSDRIIYLVSFTFGLNLIFFILSYPFLQAMSNFVHFSRSMLTIVPVEGLILCKGFDKLVLRRLKK